MIDGVVITSLKRIGDERGMVLHMLRRDWDVFEDFGEVNFSTVNPGVVKGWKRHKRMIQNFAVPMGNAKFVLYDDREGSPTMGEVQEVVLGEDNYVLLTLPEMIWYGFAGTEDGPTLIANCASLPHDPEETEGIDLSDPPFPMIGPQPDDQNRPCHWRAWFSGRTDSPPSCRARLENPPDQPPGGDPYPLLGRGDGGGPRRLRRRK